MEICNGQSCSLNSWGRYNSSPSYIQVPRKCKSYMYNCDFLVHLKINNFLKHNAQDFFLLKCLYSTMSLHVCFNLENKEYQQDRKALWKIWSRADQNSHRMVHYFSAFIRSNIRIIIKQTMHAPHQFVFWKYWIV